MRILISALVAMVLGIVLALIPFVVIARIEAQNQQPGLPSLFGRNVVLFDPPLDVKKAFSDADLRLLAISFIIAVACYAAFRTTKGKREYRSIGPMPQRI